MRIIRARGETHCWRCGDPVDLTKSGMDPLGPTIGHLREIADGGHPTDPANYALEHRQCNVTAGASFGGRRLAEQKARKNSRSW